MTGNPFLDILVIAASSCVGVIAMFGIFTLYTRRKYEKEDARKDLTKDVLRELRDEE